MFRKLQSWKVLRSTEVHSLDFLLKNWILSLFIYLFILFIYLFIYLFFAKYILPVWLFWPFHPCRPVPIYLQTMQIQMKWFVTPHLEYSISKTQEWKVNPELHYVFKKCPSSRKWSTVRDHQYTINKFCWDILKGKKRTNDSHKQKGRQWSGIDTIT